MLLITGLSGVGKTKLLNTLENQEIFVIDKVNKETWIKHNSAYYDFVKANFPSCAGRDQIDTKSLGNIVFNNPKQMELLNSFIIPNIKKYFNSLPSNAIVEYAPYMDHEKELSGIFDKVILVTKDVPVIDRKTNPIKNSSIKADYVIENNDLERGKIKLQRILKENGYV